MLITSLENDKVKEYSKLKEKKYRDQTNLFMIEGMHLILEAYKENLIEELILEQDEVCILDCPKVYVTKEIIKKISSVETPQPILALCHKKEEFTELGNKILLLDKLQDPGNLGTIIRSAKAFNIDSIILGKDSVDIYNPKVVRAAQGMMFHINIVRRNLEQLITELKQQEIPIYGTKVEFGEDIRKLRNKDKERYALLMGNEGRGVSDKLLELCDQYLFIETNYEVESLNVAVATSILLYELNRRD